MKRIFSFCVLLIISTAAFSQTGLTFSQCLTFGADGPWTPISENSIDKTSPLLIVPEGKIWKIEHAFVYTGSTTMYMNINGIKAQNLFTNTPSFPIWLKSGDVVNFYASNPISYFISILEFNAN